MEQIKKTTTLPQAAALSKAALSPRIASGWKMTYFETVSARNKPLLTPLGKATQSCVLKVGQHHPK